MWGKEKKNTTEGEGAAHPTQASEGPQEEVVNGQTVREPQEAATNREGTGRLRPSLPPLGLSHKEAGQDLTPCWFGCRGCDSLDFTPLLTMLTVPQARHKKGEGSGRQGRHSGIDLGPQLLPQHLFLPLELRDTWSLFSTGTSRQTTAGQSLQDT